jgi:hypothetical protein
MIGIKGMIFALLRIASVALGGGGPGAIAMRNRHRVVIEPQPVRQGAQLTIGVQGVEIALQE